MMTCIKVWNMFKVNNKDIVIIKTLTIDISIFDFEQVNTGWVLKCKKVYFSKDRKCGPKKSLIYRHSKNHSFFYPCLGKIDLKIIRDLDFILNIHKHTFIILWIFLFSETLLMDRSSREDVFCEKSVLKNFAKFTGKHVRLSLFFNKVAGLLPATLLKKRLWHRCFLWILRNF